MLTNTQKQAIIKYAKGKPIELVYLFGSQATGKVGPMSDYDFAVLFGVKLSSSGKFNLKTGLISELSNILKTDKVDVVDLDRAPITFQYSAIKNRQDLYVRSEHKRITFEQSVLSHYFDRLYYIKQHTNLNLANMAHDLGV